MLKSVPSANIHIPDHTIIEKIGSGGMSSVYLGRQISLQRKVAIKVLKTLVMDNQDLAERFVHEAKTIASLDHPHIITIYEAKKLSSGLTYFTMPYLNHGNFGDIICTNADHLIDLLCQICEGLAFAHNRGVIHRDLKPDNILFDQFGQLKIADFGIALSKDTERRTKDEQILGSAHFMSPEQIQTRDINYLSDIYSLGCIIYEKLTGDHVYEANNDFAVLLAHINKAPPELPKALSKWQPILNRCLAKKPEDRYQSALELKEDLLAIRSHKGNTVSKQKRQPLSLPAWLKPWQAGAVCATLLVMVLAVVLWPSNKTGTQQPLNNASLPSPLDNILDNTITEVESAQALNNNEPDSTNTTTQADSSAVVPAETTEEAETAQLVALESSAVVTEVNPFEATILPDEIEAFEAFSDEAPETTAEAVLSDDPLAIDISSMVVLDENGQVIDSPENYVDLLLAQGQALLKKYRLTKPSGESAIDRFKAVLAIEPENISAKEGINQIARYYLRLVQSKQKSGDLAKAQVYAKAMVSFADAEGVDINLFEYDIKKISDSATAAITEAIADRRKNKSVEALFALNMVFDSSPESQALFTQYQQIPQLGLVINSESSHNMVFVPGQTSKQDFMVSQNEVTVAQYKAFAGENASKDKCEHLGSKGIFKRYSWLKPPFDQTNTHPVVCITATEAQAYANWLSQKTGHNYRLPTATEWQTLNKVSGQANNCQQANLAGTETNSKSKITDNPLSCQDAHMYTAAAGSFAAQNNINDINGNVAEWTLDCTTGADCQQFALAGNSWSSGQGEKNTRINKTSKDTRVSHAGFRLVRTFD
ncbi:bifunctional serine/threonine-protein kinase/formylglycine-generating enzyme family protein [Marinicella rhabdoformis]|uniref:bifunctional serine/threonine-protein kinase/formylglycine-generating enzyme family protein n=1 Tax=Marinicella rhabdoformis TaxID=2580566 RepID=UPI0012AEDB19|nr:bifunctional serine/threonine-protein kinase/formylglycine-generating enzyme family protein [Marinicella rhabdoformis]